MKPAQNFNLLQCFHNKRLLYGVMFSKELASFSFAKYHVEIFILNRFTTWGTSVAVNIWKKGKET